MSTTKASKPPDAIDDHDRAIILFVNGYRKEHQAGPTWREVGEAVGMEVVPDASRKRFNSWWDNDGGFEFFRNGAGHSYRRFRERNPTYDEQEAEREYRLWGYRSWRGWQWRASLTPRLKRLRELGYVTFDDTERSLDVGPLVKRAQRQAADTGPSTATTGSVPRC